MVLAQGTFCENLPVLVVPWPVLFLIQRRRWVDIMLLVRWHAAFNLHAKGAKACPGLLQNYPPPDAAVWAHVHEHVPERTGSSFTKDQAMQTLATIRKHLIEPAGEELACHGLPVLFLLVAVMSVTIDILH